MLRSTAISWIIGLAVAILTLPSGQLRAQTDDGLSETVETQSQPLEPKAVRVILLPPASDDVFASRPPALVEGVPIVMVQPARKTAIAQPRPEPADIEEAEIEKAGIKEDAITIVERASVPEQAPRVALLPPATDAAIASPPPEPADIKQDAAVVENPSVPEQPPRVALLPPATDAAIASPPSEPEKTQKSAARVEIPALPGRSPFRQATAAFKSEIVEIEPKDAAILQQQQASEPAPAKGSAASRFLAKLWPGDEEEAAQDASTGEADSPAPSTAWVSTSEEQAEADAASEKPPIKRFLDGIQFWKD